MSSMATIDDEIQPNPESPVNPDKKQAKRVFIGFAATVTIGLAITGWYVGGRIYAGDKVHAEAPAIAEPVAAPLIAETIAVTVETNKPSDIPPPAWNTVDPQPGELYLQLATMGPNSTNEYLKTLDAIGIHPRVAPGPSENLHRLLMGPYQDKTAFEKQQHELEAAAIEFVARRY
jgi:hypothetical protein